MRVTDTMISHHRKWAWPLARALRASYGDLMSDDEAQALADLGLVKASRCYRNDAEASFGTYARIWVHGEVIRALQRELRFRNWRGPAIRADFRAVQQHVTRQVAARRLVRRLRWEDRALVVAHVIHDVPTRALSRGRRESASTLWRRLTRALARLRSEVARDAA